MTRLALRLTVMRKYAKYKKDDSVTRATFLNEKDQK